MDALGGAARAIERGFFQDAIARSAWELQQRQEAGEPVVVGVNRSPTTRPFHHRRPDYSALGRSRRPAREVRRSATAAVVTGPSAPSGSAAGTAPLMSPIVDAVRARATLGEISDTVGGGVGGGGVGMKRRKGERRGGG